MTNIAIVHHHIGGLEILLALKLCHLGVHHHIGGLEKKNYEH
jgi:hypothetical protein